MPHMLCEWMARLRGFGKNTWGRGQAAEVDGVEEEGFALDATCMGDETERHEIFAGQLWNVSLDVRQLCESGAVPALV
jgi:hypothetical protein